MKTDEIHKNSSVAKVPIRNDEYILFYGVSLDKQLSLKIIVRLSAKFVRTCTYSVNFFCFFRGGSFSRTMMAIDYPG